MYILVTGGAGYIGSHTVRALQRDKFKVVVLDNLVYGHKEIVEKTLKVPLIIGDIGNKELVMKILSGQHPKTNGKKMIERTKTENLKLPKKIKIDKIKAIPV